MTTRRLPIVTWQALLALVAVVRVSEAFVVVVVPPTRRPAMVAQASDPVTALWAVKKKMSAAASAALAALEEQNDLLLQDDDQLPLSKKELKRALANKKGPLLQQQIQADDEGRKDQAVPRNSKVEHDDTNGAVGTVKKSLSKKDLMLQKALELEEADSARASLNHDDDDETSHKLSPKELKALKKKEEKMSAKLDKKKAKKLGSTADEENDSDEQYDSSGTTDLNGSTTNGANGDDAAYAEESVFSEEERVENEITLEDKIRKERPPPRIRVMESSQPGYTSLRLENVGITFRNQEVLKDVTWGVQNGDRIGLVGANGAGEY